jgi:hypothetical protein
MAATFTKIDPTCLNIELIDANACLGDSLPIINSNVTTLSSSLNVLSNHISEWDSILSSFNSLSSLMIQTMLNIQTIDDEYKSPYTTIQLLSSQWSTKRFSIYYTTMYELTAYISNESNYLNQITVWLENNFPASTFATNQIVDVFVNLYYINRFVFSFQGNLTESCSPNSHSDLTITCDGAGNDPRWGGCNHDWGGRHVCDNAYNYCTKKTTKDSETYTCQGNILSTWDWTTPSGNSQPAPSLVAGNLKIDYKQYGSDEFMARVMTYTFKNQNSTWILQ